MPVFHRNPSGLLPLIALALVPLLLAQETPPDAPSIEQQDHIVSAMRRFAESYVSNLPDFICRQTTYQFQSAKNGKHSHQGATLTAKLAYSNHREQRTLELVNNKPVGSGSHSWRAPLTTSGEFGMILDSVFGVTPNSGFIWHGWETLRGHRLAVFSFAIDRQHSTMRLGLSDLAEAIVPYSGLVYGDPDTGDIWRISNNVTEIPSELRTESSATVVDYDYVDIGSKKFLLPSRAVVTLVTDHNLERNEMEFTNYRKFEAESSITFTSDDVSKTTPNGGTGTPHR